MTRKPSFAGKGGVGKDDPDSGQSGHIHSTARAGLGTSKRILRGPGHRAEGAAGCDPRAGLRMAGRRSEKLRCTVRDLEFVGHPGNAVSSICGWS